MHNNNHDSGGIWYGVFAYTFWGFLPLYWKLLHAVPALQVLSHRIIWSFVFVSLLLSCSHGWTHVVSVLKNKKNVFYLFLCGLLISANWYLYIWAVQTDHVIEASMGYYINPLVVVLLGVFVLKEKLDKWQVIAVSLAAAGVLVMTVSYGRFPWIAVSLAVSFALYGLSKKLIHVDSLTGLTLETAVVAPFALFYVISRQLQGFGAIGQLSLLSTLLLAGAGVVTATPLLWFAMGAKRIKLSVMGFLQYIAPSISLLLGVFIFKEKFTIGHAISFGLIWSGLAIFIATNLLAASNYLQKKGKAHLGKEY